MEQSPFLFPCLLVSWVWDKRVFFYGCAFFWPLIIWKTRVAVEQERPTITFLFSPKKLYFYIGVEKIIRKLIRIT